MKKIPNEILFAVYGTLKAQYGNNRLLQASGVEFKGEFKTKPDYTMVSCGGFPAVHLGGTTAISCELYKVTNPEVIKRVFGLEGFSGEKDNENNWYDVTNFDTPEGEATMFIFKGAPKRNIVESGKW